MLHGLRDIKLARGSIISLGIANPVFRPHRDSEGISDFDKIVVDSDLIADDGDEVPGEGGINNDKGAAPMTELKAQFNLTHAVSLAVGQTIGSGIFISPNGVVKAVNSVGMSLLIWVLSGTLSLCGALCFCELGTMFKRSGGEYQYIKAAYGKVTAFVYIWVCGVIRNALGIAVIALTFSNYALSLFMSDKDAGFEILQKIIATCAIALIIAVNSYSTRIGIVMQNTFTVLKLAALSVLILMGFTQLCMGKVGSLGDGFSGTSMNFAAWTGAFFSALWAYSGWNCINMMAGEIKNPKRNVPYALVITNIVMITIYLMANVSYHIILSIEELTTENAIALYAGDKFFGQFGKTWGKAGKIFFGLSVAISTFGALSSSLMGASRLPFIAAQEDMFPRFVALIQKKTGTPIVGLLYMGVTASLCCWPSNIISLIQYVGFLSWAWWMMCFAAVPGLRYTMPDHPRSFRVFLGIPVLAVLSSLYLVIGPFYATPLPCVLWVCVALLGIPIYYGYVDKEEKCARWMKWILENLGRVLKAEL